MYFSKSAISYCLMTEFSLASVLKKYPNKFVGCCLANPAEDGSGLKHLEELILKVYSCYFIAVTLPLTDHSNIFSGVYSC